MKQWLEKDAIAIKWCTLYTKHEKNIYGRNRELKNGEVAFLCRLYGQKKCKSRLYMMNGRLYKKADFIPHNHPTQERERFEFEVENKIKTECGNIDALVDVTSQASAVTEIFDKNMHK